MFKKLFGNKQQEEVKLDLSQTQKNYESLFADIKDIDDNNFLRKNQLVKEVGNTFTQGAKIIYPAEPIKTKSAVHFDEFYGIEGCKRLSIYQNAFSNLKDLTNTLIDKLEAIKQTRQNCYDADEWFIRDRENNTIILNTEFVSTRFVRWPLCEFNLPKLNKEVSNTTAVQWLWKSKLKSRDSFLMILSFINTDIAANEINQCECGACREGVFQCTCGKTVDENLTVLREIVTMSAPGGFSFFDKFVDKKQLFMNHVDNKRILYKAEKKLQGKPYQNQTFLNVFNRFKDQLVFRGDVRDERTINSDALYQKWFQDKMGNWCQGYAQDGKLHGKGLKINLKQGWIVLGYFVGGVPRGLYTRIDEQNNIYLNER